MSEARDLIRQLADALSVELQSCETLDPQQKSCSHHEYVRALLTKAEQFDGNAR